MKNNLRISNMIFTGRMWEGIKLREEEVKRLIKIGFIVLIDKNP